MSKCDGNMEKKKTIYGRAIYGWMFHGEEEDNIWQSNIWLDGTSQIFYSEEEEKKKTIYAGAIYGWMFHGEAKNLNISHRPRPTWRVLLYKDIATFLYSV